jgi:hypothetical protein
MGFAMANDKGGLPAGGQESAASGGRLGRRSDAGFDRWLGGQLRKLYDDVLNEEVPGHLIDMIRSFDEKPKGEGDDELGHGRHERARKRSRRETTTG